MHKFFEKGPTVEPEGLEWILEATSTGKLEWGKVPSYAVVGSNVGRHLSQEEFGDVNLERIRASYVPDTGSLVYLKLVGPDGLECEVIPSSDEGLILPALRVLRVARIAADTREGVLNLQNAACDTCVRPRPHITLVDSPYGLEGAYIEGSERCECVYCGATNMIAA